VKQEIARWLERSDMDLQMAEAGLNLGLWPPCVFHCQQAVEKVLKAIWVNQRETEPPRTHNLVDLAAELDLRLEEWDDYLTNLSDQAVASRYVDDEGYTADDALQCYEKARVLCELLRHLLS
jgi:HEPN domain-containing protein